MTGHVAHPEPPACRTIVVATDFDRTFTHTNLLLSNAVAPLRARGRESSGVTDAIPA